MATDRLQTSSADWLARHDEHAARSTCPEREAGRTQPAADRRRGPSSSILYPRTKEIPRSPAVLSAPRYQKVCCSDQTVPLSCCYLLRPNDIATSESLLAHYHQAAKYLPC